MGSCWPARTARAHQPFGRRVGERVCRALRVPCSTPTPAPATGACRCRHRPSALRPSRTNLVRAQAFCGSLGALCRRAGRGARPAADRARRRPLAAPADRVRAAVRHPVPDPAGPDGPPRRPARTSRPSGWPRWSRAWSHDAAGVTGVHLLRALALVVLAGLVHATARTWADPVAAVLVTAGVLVGTSAGWGERPQLLGIVAAALTLLLWCRTLRRRAAPVAPRPRRVGVVDVPRLVAGGRRHGRGGARRASP